MYKTWQPAQPANLGFRLTEYFYKHLGKVNGISRNWTLKRIVSLLEIKTLVAFLCLTLAVPPFACAENEPVFKPDVPKLDNYSARTGPQSAHEGTHPKMLTGKVEHAEKLKKKKKLFSSAEKESNEGKFAPQQGKAALDKRILKSRSQQELFDIQAQSSIGIIGVKFVMTYGSPPVINRVFPDTPASRVGLRVNDVIVAVDGIPTLGLTKEEVFDMIIGTPNTPVTVSVKRNGDYQARTMNRMDFNDIIDPAVKRDYMMSM